MLGTDPRPRILPPKDLIPLPIAIGCGLMLAIGLLFYLMSHQGPSQEKSAQNSAPAPTTPPELVVPPPPEPKLPPVRVVVEPPARADATIPRPVPQPRYEQPRYEQPMPPYQPQQYADTSLPQQPQPSAIQSQPTSGQLIVIDKGRAISAGQSIAERSPGEDDSAKATLIRNRGFLIPQGTVIAAVLETPLDSDRPGLARATVTRDVRGFDGNNILIPKGSRLIGDFKAETAPGLRRIAVSWNRLMRPDGAAIQIRSPSADALGRAGIGGRTNNHMGERLLGAVLQSALTIGVNVASALPSKNNSTIYVGLPGQAQQLGEQLIPKVDRPPTVKVRPGKEVSVLVARDLDFSGVPLGR